MERSIRCGLALVLLLAGCEDEEGEPQLVCESLEDRDLVFCDDFADGTASAWRPEGGSWSVVDGRYVGSGPASLDAVPCGASRMTASLREGSASTERPPARRAPARSPGSTRRWSCARRTARTASS
ncbi:MAG: hypothetical protein M5U28_39635 [Sandaracinaceae bacterium]|nr:hypothetical protein [Sandaracinaceae bacterium]